MALGDVRISFTHNYLYDTNSAELGLMLGSLPIFVSTGPVDMTHSGMTEKSCLQVSTNTYTNVLIRNIIMSLRSKLMTSLH